MRVTLWKPRLFIINRAENKRIYISINICSFGFKNCVTSKYFVMIFEYFVFSTVYIRKLFSGVNNKCKQINCESLSSLQCVIHEKIVRMYSEILIDEQELCIHYYNSSQFFRRA